MPLSPEGMGLPAQGPVWSVSGSSSGRDASKGKDLDLDLENRTAKGKGCHVSGLETISIDIHNDALYNAPLPAFVALEYDRTYVGCS